MVAGMDNNRERGRPISLLLLYSRSYIWSDTVTNSSLIRGGDLRLKC